ncbi:MAG: thiamine ABC transporter substrate-binding protein [Spirochaetota bacterium]
MTSAYLDSSHATAARARLRRRAPGRRAALTLALAAAFALVIVAPLFATGEAETEGPQADSAPAAGGEQEPTDELVIYSYDAFPESLEAIIVEHFEEEYGVTPALERFQDTGGLYNQVWLERSNPGADVVVGLDNTYVGRALEADLFQPYRPAGADRLRDDVVIDPDYRLTPFDWGHIVLNYDSERLSDPPTTWDELLDPRLRESIILMNPATSSPGRNFLLLTIAVHGEDGYLDYWRELEPNILTVTSGWSEGYGLYTQGEAPIVLSYESSPPYHIEYEDTDRYRNLIIDDQGYLQIEVAGIAAGASNVVNARRLMDFLMTEQFQRELPLNQFMYPVARDIGLPDSFERVAKASESVFIPVDRVDEDFDRWLEEWREVMQ